MVVFLQFTDVFNFYYFVSDSAQFHDAHVLHVDAGDVTAELAHQQVVRCELAEAAGVVVGTKTLKFHEIFGS